MKRCVDLGILAMPQMQHNQLNKMWLAKWIINVIIAVGTN